MTIAGRLYRQRSWWVAPLLLVSAAGAAGASCQNNESDLEITQERPEHAPGDSMGRMSTLSLGKAHPIVLPTINGATFDLSEHGHSVVVVNFWATWCAPCLEEIPEFVRLQDELGEQGLSASPSMMRVKKSFNRSSTA